MTTENNPIGAVMLDIQGTELEASDREMLTHPNVGGVILFARNYADVAQLCALTTAIKTLRPELLIAVDHEGGRVQRFANQFCKLPPMQVIGTTYLNDSVAGLQLAYNAGWLMASELLAVGVDLSFAPVLDLDYGNSSVIGDRAFAASAELVTTLAERLIDGMADAGMPATGKHFPGHGYVALDSHLECPVDNRDLKHIMHSDVAPYAALIQKHKLRAVMSAHVVYSQVDAAPAGFSSVWLQDILRGELGFDGVIFSDDLNMAGAGSNIDITTRANMALGAGADMILACNNPAAACRLIDKLNLPSHWHKTAMPRVRALKNPNPVLSMSQLKSNPSYQQAIASMELL